MSDIAPGWYPDPAGSERQRWWDGAQWTEHVHPPVAGGHPDLGAGRSVFSSEQTTEGPGAATGVSGPAKKSSAKKRWLIGGSIAAVTVLVVGLGVVGIRSLASLAGFGTTIALPTESEPVPDRDYEMTEPLLGISPDSEFSFPADYDFDARTGEDSFSYAWAFEVFLDPALTSRADVFIWQSEPGADLSVSPSESSSLMNSNDDMVDVMAHPWGWGLEHEYYLVRHIDEHGETLDTPVVTKFTPETPAMEGPDVEVDTDEQTGSMVLRWTPVEGATDYLVVGSYAMVTDHSEGRMYSLLAETSGTEWSSVEDFDPYSSEPKQNASLVMFDDQSADDMLGSGVVEDDWVYETSAYRFGVIATNGSDYSQISTAETASVISALPYENAHYAMGGTTMVFDAWELAEIPVSFAFTSLDGRTRATQAEIPEDGVHVSAQGDITFDIHGIGTQLIFSIEWINADEGFDAEAFRLDYNRRAAAAAPTTGGTALISKTLEEVEIDAKPVDVPAEVDFPVYGSDDFVRFIAGHLIAGTELIDVTEFAEAPGAQSVYDALSEAMAQNPYIVGVAGYNEQESFGAESTVTLRIEYELGAEERTSIQQSISDTVDEVVAAVVTDGMSDRDKALALNDWVVAQTEYDYSAFDALNNGESLEPFRYAWRADGAFDSGLAVCGGYAMAYNALMNEAGVPTVYVTGDVIEAGRHAWNKVQIDGAWLAVDTTWNDSPGGNRYFLITDAEFTDSATRSEDTEWVRDDLIGAYVAG